MSKSQIISSAKKRWGKNGRYEVRHNPKALTAAKADELKARIQEFNDLLNESMAESKQIAATKPKTELVRMARFVVDVNGDPDAVAEMAAVLERVERMDHLEDYRKQIRRDRDRLISKRHQRRYELIDYRRMPGIGWMGTHLADGDTLSEVLVKVKSGK